MRALYSGADGWKNDLTNSLALSAGKKLTYTPTVTGNRRQFTIMMNVRRVRHGVIEYLVSAGSASTLYFHSDDTLRWGGTAATGSLHTSRKFRDTEWMFIGFAFDSVARTMKMVVNDEEIDSFTTNTLPTANYQTFFNYNGSITELGGYNGGAGLVEANVSDFVLLDGEVLTPQEMINYRTQNVPFGNNVITTTKKFTTEDKQERYISLYRNDSASNTTKILDEGKYVERSTSSWDTIHSDVLPSTGRYLIEFGLGADAFNAVVGIGPAENTSPRGGFTTNTFGNFTGITFSGSSLKSFNNASTTIDPPEWGANVTHDMFSMYIDMDARTAILAINGVELPTVHSITSGDVRYYIDLHSLNPGASVNFGQTDYKYPKAGYGPLKEPNPPELEYGPNGTQLLFEDASDLGKSTVGNLVSWSLTGITSDDQLTDTPGDPYAILSAIATYGTGVDISRGGLRSTTNGSANNRGSYASFTSSHKIYCEAVFEASAADNNGGIGLGPIGIVPGESSDSFRWMSASTQRKGGVKSALGTNITAGQTVMIAFDPATGNAWIGKEGTWIGGGDPAAGTSPTVTGLASDCVPSSYHYSTSAYIVFNFGQKPFTYTPPNGFKELKSSNRETPQYHGRDKFDVVLRYADHIETKVYPAVKPTAVWTKSRNGAYSHSLYDVLRGAGKYLRPDVHDAEGDYIETLKLFEDNGYTLGTSNESNRAGNNYVDWLFGLDGTEVTNNDGTIPSQVIADSSGYMSLVEHVGDGQTTSTVGHGLGDVPELIISKNLETTQDWVVHSGIMTTGWIGSDSWLKLHTGSGQVTGTLLGADPTSEVFQPINSRNNGNGQRHLHILFRSVDGLSKIFSYKGTGSSTNGPNIDLGFKARWVMFKRIDSSGSWWIYDTERDTIQPMDVKLRADDSTTELTASHQIDFNADSLKLRMNNADFNASGATYIGLAIADVAGGGNLPAILGN
ncbi:hypothetical protein WH96_06380 [Kiloniella spongiae]|uniref:DUF7483 domain-containing protein n=1 Tax=Kiloniella spongiae TaxID=1489064 RepID=A0A0H2MH74_9PROT|nr:hypothetical protein [Kiloniella spongiae]KLN61899.1 hypothetical protein WH96_06380 [Kiloniella spongiae]